MKIQLTKKRISIISVCLVLVLLFSLIISSLGYFSDTIFANSSGTTGTVQVGFDDSGINLLNPYGQDILNPGDARPVKFTVTNEGNKSVDTEVVITLTSSEPMSDNRGNKGAGNFYNKCVNANEYDLYWTEELSYNEGYGYYAIGNTWPIGNQYIVKANKTQVVYVLDGDVLSGNSSLDEQEVEYMFNGEVISNEEYQALSDAEKANCVACADSKTYDISLLFDPYSSNKFQDSSVSIQIEIRAKQHRNTEAGWELVAEKVTASIDTNVFTVEYDKFGRVAITGVQDGVDLSTMTDVVIPEGVQVIPAEFFNNNTSIQTVTLPSTIEEISDSAFQGCENLTTINLPEGLEAIGDKAFQECLNLTNVVLPSTITTIGHFAFQGCENLATINFPETLTKIGDCAFSYTGLTSVELHEGMTIGFEAFMECMNLTEITIPANNVFLYGDQAGENAFPSATFNTCANLTTVIFEDGVTSIPFGMMAGVPNLTTIVIPDSVTGIGSLAFDSGLGSMKNVTIYTNNSVAKNYDWASYNINPTFLPYEAYVG